MTNPADPKDHEEYLQRFRDGEKVEGYGLDVTMTTACPFCAAPNWMTWPVLKVREAMSKGATCTSCGRSAKAIFADHELGAVSFEMVQTGGDDPAEWLVPKMRRLP